MDSMILDKMTHLNLYLQKQAIKIAEDFAASAGELAPGRYELEMGMYAMVQEGTTKPVDQGLFETHRKYIDLQMVIAGEEILQWADIADLKTQKAYDADRDAEFFEGSGIDIVVKPGMIYIMYPHDGHKPCAHRGQATTYRKLVVKIPI
jgi:biofilm protein TabA